MSKAKRRTQHPLIQVWIAQPFASNSNADPRTITRQMSRLVRYPRQINDVGRTVQVRRIAEGQYRFTIDYKRYLGRGAYALSARVRGDIRAADGVTVITGTLRQGRWYLTLLTMMSTSVLLSFTLLWTAILFLPLALLMSAVIALHWGYLLYDRQQLLYDVLGAIADSEDRLAMCESDDNNHINGDEVIRYQRFYR